MSRNLTNGQEDGRPDTTDHGALEFSQADQMTELLDGVPPGSVSDTSLEAALSGDDGDDESAREAAQRLEDELLDKSPSSKNKLGNEQPKEDEEEDGDDDDTPPTQPNEPAQPTEDEDADEEDTDVIARMRQKMLEQAEELARLRAERMQPQENNQNQPGQQGQGQSSGQATQQQQEQQSRTQTPPTPVALVTADRLAKITSDPNEFNKVLQETTALAQENFIRVAAQLIPQLIQRQFTYHEAVSEFYRENEDLKPVRNYVQMKAQEYQAANPQETDILKIFNEAAKMTRKDLAIAAKAKALEPPKGGESKGGTRTPRGGGRPAFATGNKGGRGTGTIPSKSTGNTQQDQINDLIS